MSSPADVTAVAVAVLARRYDCELTEAAAMLQHWSQTTSIDAEDIAAWITRDPPHPGIRGAVGLLNRQLGPARRRR